MAKKKTNPEELAPEIKEPVSDQKPPEASNQDSEETKETLDDVDTDEDFVEGVEEDEAVLCEVIKSHPAYGYFAGDIAEISRKAIKSLKLVEEGFIKIEE